MRYLLALAFVLLSHAGRFVARFAPLCGGVLAAIAGIWYALKINNRAAGALAVCYFALELCKLLMGRGRTFDSRN